MSDQLLTDRLPDEAQHPASWKWLLALGVLMTLGGFIALINPFAASVTAVVIASATFAVAGVLQIIMAFSNAHGTRSRLGNALLGALLILFAIILVANPIAGIVSLTLLVGAFFLAAGITRVVIAMKLRDRKGWGWLAASGVVSALLGLMTLFAAPAGALGLLGIFLGVDLLFSGAGAIALSLALKRELPTA